MEFWSEIIAEIDGAAALIALFLLVVSGMAIPMTRGASPNVRTGVFVFLAVGFFGACVWAFLPAVQDGGDEVTAEPDQTGTGDAPDAAQQPAQIPAVPLRFESLLTNQPVARGNRLAVGQDYRLVVDTVGANSCDITIRAQASGNIVGTHQFTAPGPFDHDGYRIYFTRTGTAGLRSVCYFDTQQAVAASDDGS